MALPATKEIRRRLRDSYDLDLLYWETMGLPTGDTKEKPLRELAALLEAAGTLGRRIVVAFQPHRFSRTFALMKAFGPALAGADHIVLTDIYSAGEDPIPGVTMAATATRHNQTKNGKTADDAETRG